MKLKQVQLRRWVTSWSLLISPKLAHRLTPVLRHCLPPLLACCGSRKKSYYNILRIGGFIMPITLIHCLRLTLQPCELDSRSRWRDAAIY
ncbi:uncharacterized protein EI97DRAFT_70114 [Westerdykella ornata]|uniref:Uncharacterized protein n=1 Tax=Westerdykella ornata TaxID=318751 RepID=A0A6A6JIF1_WESOR|nr:uncharacterized protein EI97DRAFT_70114 [Westerdykella ornata]KAF2275708.1 hypothetical protein EI97DRAFT_70114 [Westerdykella ornata]